jgi:hypothetical protein
MFPFWSVIVRFLTTPKIRPGTAREVRHIRKAASDPLVPLVKAPYKYFHNRGTSHPMIMTRERQLWMLPSTCCYFVDSFLVEVRARQTDRVREKCTWVNSANKNGTRAHACGGAAYNVNHGFGSVMGFIIIIIIMIIIPVFLIVNSLFLFVPDFNCALVCE